MKRNVKKEAGLINALTGEYLELDVFLPGASLAFEYQVECRSTIRDYTSLISTNRNHTTTQAPGMPLHL